MLESKQISVLMGGDSPEREVSLRSGEKVYQALKRNGYSAHKVEISRIDEIIRLNTDIVFNCLHGGAGEDGTVQILLEVLGIPYTGSSVLASYLALNKPLAKEVFISKGLLTAPYLQYKDNWESWQRKVEEEIGYPLVVKPSSEGSSLGVRMVNNRSKLKTACMATHKEYGDFFVERYIPGKEITAAILRVDGKDMALPLIELRPKTEFYNYEAKYTPGMCDFIIPAELDDETAAKVQKISLQAHHALGCFGFSRVDLRVTPQDEIYLLEVNTIPGMTQTSDLPKAAAAAGMDFYQLIKHMLMSAVEKINN